MLQDQINSTARACKVPIKVRAIMAEGQTVSVFVSGQITDNTRAFLARFFLGRSVFVCEA